MIIHQRGPAISNDYLGKMTKLTSMDYEADISTLPKYLYKQALSPYDEQGNENLSKGEICTLVNFMSSCVGRSLTPPPSPPDLRYRVRKIKKIKQGEKLTKKDIPSVSKCQKNI